MNRQQLLHIKLSGGRARHWQAGREGGRGGLHAQTSLPALATTLGYKCVCGIGFGTFKCDVKRVMLAVLQYHFGSSKAALYIRGNLGNSNVKDLMFCTIFYCSANITSRVSGFGVTAGGCLL